MRFLVLILTSFALFSCTPKVQELGDVMIEKPSGYSVSITTDRLVSEIEAKGATVMARINHGAGGKKIGMDFGEVELLIFGNPKMGSPLMKQQKRIGLDLPLKILVWDENGQTMMGFNDPAKLGQWYGFDTQMPIFGKMRGVLEHVTREAGRTNAG
ncbi:hypothetical protein MNBD_ALPHA06-43 [hydrothermal vent metagenome]|uniref:DUF302 domain-containing protein n=1 Tax=hydrothermal vent metagenome TaxID=652676 RepID=A0A3B0RTS9_9ZZZZ